MWIACLIYTVCNIYIYTYIYIYICVCVYVYVYIYIYIYIYEYLFIHTVNKKTSKKNNILKKFRRSLMKEGSSQSAISKHIKYKVDWKEEIG